MNDRHLPIETLIDYTYRELTPHDDARVMQHVSSCVECRARLDEEAQIGDSLRAYAAATERELPVSVIARIWDTVEKEHAAPSWLENLRAYLRPAYALPVAAALVAALYFGVAGQQHTTTTANIDAAYYLEDHAALTSTVPFNEGTVVPASLENEETGSDQHWVASTGASDIASER